MRPNNILLFILSNRSLVLEAVTIVERVARINFIFLQTFINNVSEYCYELPRMELLEVEKGHQETQKFLAMLTPLTLR